MYINKCRILVIAALMIGVLIGIAFTKHFNNYAESCQIKYVSQEELMFLEHERVKDEPIENRQLFFGQTSKAAKLAVTIPKNFEDSITLVVYSAGIITGKNVKSISKQVHENIISELAKDKAE